MDDTSKSFNKHTTLSVTAEYTNKTSKWAFYVPTLKRDMHKSNLITRKGCYNYNIDMCKIGFQNL